MIVKINKRNFTTKTYRLNIFKVALMKTSIVLLKLNALKSVKKVRYTLSFSVFILKFKTKHFQFLITPVMEISDLILSREFSKQGCIKSLRAKLWSQMLNINLEPLVMSHQLSMQLKIKIIQFMLYFKDTIYYNYLMQCVLDHDLMIDTIYYKDVKTIPTNDDQVFVFEDLLYQVLLLFSRDTHVLKCYEKYSVQLAKGSLKGVPAADKASQVIYPPNGFIPFEGFSMLGNNKLIFKIVVVGNHEIC